MECLAKCLRDAGSVHGKIIRLLPAGKLLSNLLFPVFLEGAAGQRRGVQENQGLQPLGMVQGEARHCGATHGMADQGERLQAQCLYGREEVSGEGFDRVIRFQRAAIGIAGAAVADRDGAKSGRLQDFLHQLPDATGRPIAVHQNEHLGA